jgi:hypothetical protein
VALTLPIIIAPLLHPTFSFCPVIIFENDGTDDTSKSLAMHSPATSGFTMYVYHGLSRDITDAQKLQLQTYSCIAHYLLVIETMESFLTLDLPKPLSIPTIGD